MCWPTEAAPPFTRGSRRHAAEHRTTGDRRRNRLGQRWQVIPWSDYEPLAGLRSSTPKMQLSVIDLEAQEIRSPTAKRALRNQITRSRKPDAPGSLRADRGMTRKPLRGHCSASARSGLSAVSSAGTVTDLVATLAEIANSDWTCDSSTGTFTTMDRSGSSCASARDTARRYRTTPIAWWRRPIEWT